MVAFLSPGWIEALDAAASSSEELARLAANVQLVIEQRVTGAKGGDVTYHVTFDGGTVSVRPGPASAPTIRFAQDLATAVDIASGASSAQRAFMTGRLRVGGDLSVVLTHGELLSGLDDVFAPVRAITELPVPDGADA